MNRIVFILDPSSRLNVFIDEKKKFKPRLPGEGVGAGGCLRLKCKIFCKCLVKNAAFLPIRIRRYRSNMAKFYYVFFHAVLSISGCVTNMKIK